MANSNQMTKVIDTKIYPLVKNTLSKSLTKFKSLMSNFMSTRSKGLYDTFPATRMLYGQQDADMLCSTLGVKANEIQGFINETYYGKIANFNPRAAKDPVTVLCMCMIKYFHSKRDQKNLELAMIYTCFTGKFYPSIHYAQYPKAVPADYRFVCDYVVNNELSDKFLLKTEGNVIGVMRNTTQTWIDTYKDRFTGVTDDEDYVYTIQQLHVRIKSFIKNTAEVYYKCYNDKDYLTYESDDMSQDNFRLTQNDSTKIDTAVNRTLTYITSHDVDYRLCKMCSDENVKTDEIRSIIESIVKNTDNLDLMRELLYLMVSTYFQSSSTKDVRDIDFITFSIKAKPNTKNKDILRQGEVVEELLMSNSTAYSRRKSRKATQLSYNRAILTYFALIINSANK